MRARSRGFGSVQCECIVCTCTCWEEGVGTGQCSHSQVGWRKACFKVVLRACMHPCPLHLRPHQMRGTVQDVIDVRVEPGSYISDQGICDLCLRPAFVQTVCLCSQRVLEDACRGGEARGGDRDRRLTTRVLSATRPAPPTCRFSHFRRAVQAPPLLHQPRGLMRKGPLSTLPQTALFWPQTTACNVAHRFSPCFYVTDSAWLAQNKNTKQMPP